MLKDGKGGGKKRGFENALFNSFVCTLSYSDEASVAELYCASLVEGAVETP